MNQSDQNEFINSIQSSFKNTSYNFDTLKINVDISSWIDTHKILKKDFNLSFFNWLSAVDWDNEVKTGDAPKEPVTPSFEILSCLSQTNSNNLVISSTVISKENAEIESLMIEYPNFLILIYKTSSQCYHSDQTFVKMYHLKLKYHQNL